jgi:hypothetical protein
MLYISNTMQILNLSLNTEYLHVQSLITGTFLTYMYLYHYFYTSNLIKSALFNS